MDAEWFITVKKREVRMSADISYMGVHNNAWMRIAMWRGSLIENIVQALARDLMVYGALCVEQGGYQVVGSVHDEIITEVPDNPDFTLAEMGGLACTNQAWSEGIPLNYSGYEGYRYKKD